MSTLTLYRDIAPGAFGRHIPAEERYRPCSSRAIGGQLRQWQEENLRNVALAGTTINATDEIALRLGRAFARLPPLQRPTIELVEWLPAPIPGPEILSVLRSAERIEIPFQSTDPLTRRRYRQRYRASRYRRALQELEAQRLQPTLVIDVGLPGESIGSVLETLRAAYSLAPRRAAVRRFCVEPGSFFDRNRKRFQVVADQEPPFRIRAHTSVNALILRWTEELALRSTRSYNYWVRRRENT